MFNLVDKAWAMAGSPQGAAGGAPTGMDSLMQFVPLVLIFVVFYFLLIRPQQKKQKELQEMINGIRKSDKVITSGGLYGVVENVKENTIVLKIAEKVKVEVLKSAVQSKR